MIGVAGGSGSGKTTVVPRIIARASATTRSPSSNTIATTATGNDLRLEERAALNYDHPDSLETDLLVRHVLDLRAGRTVECRVYDFARYARQAGQPRPSRRARRSSSKAS